LIPFAGALGSAIIAHWTFSIQEKGLLGNTTLLERLLGDKCGAQRMGAVAVR